MSWQNATAYILDDVEKSHEGEKSMHTFWQVYYEKNKTDYYLKFLLSKFFAIGIRIKSNHVLFCMENIRNGKIGRDINMTNMEIEIERPN